MKRGHMAILCETLKSEDPMVWIMEQFVPLCNLVEDVLYGILNPLLPMHSILAKIQYKMDASSLNAF